MPSTRRPARPPADEAAPAVRRTRRRQVSIVAGTLLGVIALAAASILGIRTVLTGEGGTPASSPVVTSSMNGISISQPEDWHLIDPDEAGLNGPVDLTRTFPGSSSRCRPSRRANSSAVRDSPSAPTPTFLMTVQEEPLALHRGPSGPGPVGLRADGRRRRRDPAATEVWSTPRAV